MKNLQMSLELLQTLNPLIPVLPLHRGPAANSLGPAASANYSDEYSAQSQDSGRTVFYPDLHVLTKEEQWTVTAETSMQPQPDHFVL